MVERERRILDALDARGSVLVADLATELGVSAVTVRKDLDALERRRLLRRTRGGAMPPVRGDEGAFAERLITAARAKRQIAAEAARRVDDGAVVALDTSSTAHYLAQLLVHRQGLVIVTQSLPTATLFLEHSSATVVMPGGVLRRESAGLVGSFGDVLGGRGRIDVAFVGVVGLSPERGLLELSPAESEAKRALLSTADRIVALLDASKIGGFGLHAFVEADRVTEIITDAAASDDFVDEWRALGVPVTRADDTSTETYGASAPAMQRAEGARITAKEQP